MYFSTSLGTTISWRRIDKGSTTAENARGSSAQKRTGTDWERNRTRGTRAQYNDLAANYEQTHPEETQRQIQKEQIKISLEVRREEY